MVNFQYWLGGSFSFPPVDIYNISGPSESGKTSIFRAIRWVLYGDRDLPPYNLYHKTKMTTVDMEINGIKFHRRTRPAKIEITLNNGILLQGPEAESYIELNYGTIDMWKHSCYCSSQYLDDFFASSSANIAKYFEKMSFPDSSLTPGEILDRINANILSLDKKTKYLHGQIEQIGKLINDIIIASDIEIAFLSPDFHVGTTRNQVQELETRKENWNKIMIENKQKEIRINQINEELSGINLYEYDEVYEQYIPSNIDLARKRKEALLLFDKEEFAKLDKIFNPLFPISTHKINEQKKIKSIIFKEELFCKRFGLERNRDIVDEYIKKYEKAKECKSISNKISNLTSKKNSVPDIPEIIEYTILSNKEEEELKRLVTHIEIQKNMKDHLKCPVCDSFLSLSGDVLEKVIEIDECNTNDIQERGDEIIEKLRLNDETKKLKIEYETNLHVIQQIRERTIKSNEELDKEIDSLNKTMELDVDLDILSEISDKDILQLSNMEYCDLKFDPDEYEKYLSLRSQSKILDSSEHLSLIDKLDHTYLFIDLPFKIKSNKENKLRIQKLQQELDTISLTDIEPDLEKVNDQIKSLRQQIEQFPLFEKRNSLIKELEKLNDEYDTILNKIKLLSSIKEKTIDEESKHLSSIIDSVSSNMSIILSELFEGELSVQIVSKNTSNSNRTKRMMSLIIIRNGIEIKYSQLSEGTKARMKLALAIAQGHLSKFPYILIDEMLSTLDDENYEKTMECIRTYCKSTGKRVIKISHTRKSVKNCLYL